MSKHATDLEIELYRTGEALEATVEHLADCPKCLERYKFFAELENNHRLSETPADIPPKMNNAIIALARQQALAIRQQRFRRRIVAVAGAAAVVLVMLMSIVVMTPHRDRPVLVEYTEADVNRDGRVDILDALVLVRLSETDSEKRLDLNKDGRIDNRDVDLVVHESVALNKGSS